MVPSTSFLNYRNNVGCITIKFLLFQIRIPVEKAADVFFPYIILLGLLPTKYIKIGAKWILLFLESHVELILILCIFNLQPRRYFRLQACSRKRWWELLLLGKERSWH